MTAAMEQAIPLLDMAIRVSVAVFMAGNLLAIGLETEAHAAGAALRDWRYVGTVVLLDWVVSPALAVAVVWLLPIAEPYAVALLLISLAPAAPFLPMMVRAAGGDTAATAAFMLLAVVGTVILMPLGAPLVIPGLEIEAWTVARPLVVLLVGPMAAGLLVRSVSAAVADRLLRLVRPVATFATLVLLLAVTVRYFDGIVGSVGSFALAAQCLYAAGLTGAGWLVGAALPRRQRIVVSLGVCTRNLGAALAPLLVADPEPRMLVMVALGIPVTLGVTALAAKVMRMDPEGNVGR